MKRTILASMLLACAMYANAAQGSSAAVPSDAAVKAAKYAVTTYRTDVVKTLTGLVSFNTVADPKIPSDQDPQHIAFKNYLKTETARLGFDFADHGWVVVIGMGKSDERVGIVTHGDVQPVDPSKWKKSPFVLDQTSEPGKLLARGAEDDKGPIATAMYAMKALKDQQLPLSKRIELYVYMGEESNWQPLVDFLKTHEPPQMNITLDAEYPAVVAEKASGTIAVTFPKANAVVPVAGTPHVAAFAGGFFGSQIPEDASATIANASEAIEAQVRARGAQQEGMRYTFARKGADLEVRARGVSAHSSKPEDGVNAVAMLADALAVQPWPNTSAGAAVNYLNQMVGTGLYGEKFGNIAYRDSFMGPMTVAPTVIRQKEEGIEVSLNLRRPRGKSVEQLTGEVNAALAAWQGRNIALANVTVRTGEPWLRTDAPQLPILMNVFSYFTGMKDPKPVAIGGGTNSRLFPNAVSFGPGMPGQVYTGHSEHEFITLKQLLLNLQMYTAVLAELAK
ncbi:MULTISPECIES: dipeptidase [unclassified Massilia]|uniref:dipeptidase n=1 Tax=unclassified Massilia TaxID=2609279 RepID=UPI001783322B|nr:MULTISPECIES: dipeptidase [unclassified Massilia]MBD8533042.1 dipeptidase [Massilia sp. CFBP 13647]MBD8676402.1 dipeptidase [Massilia sp. CFBP 13721]